MFSALPLFTLEFLVGKIEVLLPSYRSQLVKVGQCGKSNTKIVEDKGLEADYIYLTKAVDGLAKVKRKQVAECRQVWGVTVNGEGQGWQERRHRAP